MALFLVGGLLVAAASPPAGSVSADGPLVWNQLGSDIAGDAAGDLLGSSVAMSEDGTTVVVGAPNNDGNGERAGRASVFRFDGVAWVPLGGDIDGADAGDRLGGSVAMSFDGTTVIAGAASGGDGAGTARVFQFDGVAWAQLGADIDGEAAGDGSGGSVSMSGDGLTVVIGAGGNDGNGDSAGHARVFRFDGVEWAQVGSDIDGEAPRDFSGGSVSMSGDGLTVVIGAGGNDGNGDAAGHARVFRFDGVEWVQVGSDIDGEAEENWSGSSVATSADGSSVIIGAPTNDANGLWEVNGHARVFRFDGVEWMQVGADIDGIGDSAASGTSVAINGDGSVVAVGAPEFEGIARQSGQVRVFEFDGASWVQVGADIDGEFEVSVFGESVAMSGDGTRVIGGGPLDSASGTFAGHARVFELGAPKEPLVCGDTSGTVAELEAAGFNVIVGTEDSDFLPGTPGDDFVLGLGGNDVILAGMGDDVVCAGADHDVVVGGDGADWLQLDVGNDWAWGGNGDDWIDGGKGDDVLSGGDGADEVSGGNANDRIRGGNEDDVLRGGAGKDDIRGDAGNDMLFGDAADDVLRGHVGIDVCDGGTHVGGDQAFSCETVIDIP